MTSHGLHVALVGLGFGAEFVPIYQAHPDVGTLTIVDPDASTRDTIGDRFGIPPLRRLATFEQVLASPAIDAVHLVTPIPLHAAQSISSLRAGKHCACTVPMATTLDDIQAIVAAERETGKVYMGMETAVYTRRFLYVQDLVARGELGRIQFLRGAHYQDMESWPAYWQGLPPMHYATHAIAPLLALAGTGAREVRCLGSGTMRLDLHERYCNPFPIETAIFTLDSERPLAAEVTRSLFHTARDYTESFSVYGEERSFEWEQIEGEAPVVFQMCDGPRRNGRGRSVAWQRLDVPDRQDLLPPEIARFTQEGVYDESANHRSFIHGGGHGGSHPHLVHEFVRSVVEGRPAAANAAVAASWTAPGICAHESALRGGECVEIPAFA